MTRVQKSMTRWKKKSNDYNKGRLCSHDITFLVPTGTQAVSQSRKQLKSQKQMQTQMDADSPVQWHIWN